MSENKQTNIYRHKNAQIQKTNRGKCEKHKS